MFEVRINADWMMKHTGGLTVKKWLDEHCEGIFTLDYEFLDKNSEDMVFLFENELDAMAFKLRWT